MFHSQWFHCFKNFLNIICVKVSGGAVSADSNMAGESMKSVRTIG
jgi:hypothetical protein